MHPPFSFQYSGPIATALIDYRTAGKDKARTADPLLWPPQCRFQMRASLQQMGLCAGYRRDSGLCAHPAALREKQLIVPGSGAQESNCEHNKLHHCHSPIAQV